MWGQESFSEAGMSAKELEWVSKTEEVGKESADNQVRKRKWLFLKYERRIDVQPDGLVNFRCFFIRDFSPENSFLINMYVYTRMCIYTWTQEMQIFRIFDVVIVSDIS